jgi:signal transduction histidine kinase
MAEVATDVLHNVGNVLNSVNISAAAIYENLSESHLINIKKVAEMFVEHNDDLGTFLSKDSRGKHIPDYLIKTIELLINEQTHLIEKVQSIRANIDHIKEIINMQQAHARTSNFQIESSLIEVVEDAIKINLSNLERYKISIVKEYGEVGRAIIDKPRLLQIITNLIRNASEALVASDQEKKKLTIRCCKHQDKNLLRIEVIDNGIGISQENLTQIFQHGFTTKRKGHGFGLHSSALAANEMGGSLSAQSQGLGHGTKFVLEFPLRLERMKHDARTRNESTHINN